MLKPRESIYERYVPTAIPGADSHGPYQWFVFSGNRLLVREDGGTVVTPLAEDAAVFGLPVEEPLYLGTWEGVPSYTALAKADAEAPEGYAFTGLRALYGSLSDGLFHLAGRAYQIAEWNAAHRFCGRCGTPMDHSDTERSKKCLSCGLTSYPPVSPAVITAIFREGRILLAHAKHFQNNMHSLIAGFVEPGETLEDAVRREIREEVGLQVRNIRYFGSQQWPFPNSLMIGFMADYESGEITVDGEEIVFADWFEPDRLPVLPHEISIARKMIDWYVEQRGSMVPAARCDDAKLREL